MRPISTRAFSIFSAVCCPATWWRSRRSGFSRHAVLRCAMKLQQYSGPVMAKGLEDTAFYRYNRFVALNEVGGYPDQFGITVANFHKANAQRCEALAALDADHVDARYQARRGCARPAGGVVRNARTVGQADAPVEPYAARAPRRYRSGGAARTATTNICFINCWRRRGRSRLLPAEDAACDLDPVRPAKVRRAAETGDDEIDARSQSAFHVGVAEHRL